MTNGLEDFKNQLQTMKESYDKDDSLRDQIIKQSRDILKPSKLAIYAVHKGDMNKAQELVAQAKEVIKKVYSLIKESSFESQGAFKAGLEEYVEAVCFINYIKTNKLPLKKDIEDEFLLPDATYLGGLGDFVGELTRRVVLLATKKEYDEVKKIHELIQEIYGLFLAFDFRNGELRKKFDGLKYSLAKVESITYDLSLKQ